MVCSEIMHAICIGRNRAHIDAEDHSGPRILGIGLARLRLRVRADHRRLPAADFDIAWGRHGDIATVGPNGLIVNF